MKKRIALLCSLSMLLALLGACGSAAAGSPAPTNAGLSAQATQNATGEVTASLTPVMTEFSAATLDGGTFTQDDLADYDLTMVNVWTTWCGYCVTEMPELQKLYEALPDNVNLISVCCDADTDSDTALLIMKDNGCAFAALIPDDALNSSLVSRVSGFPTTFFVDSEGNMVGAAQVGVPSLNNAAEAYMTLINDRLASLGLEAAG